MKLEPYSAADPGWTRAEAQHLLWRACGGASAAEIDRSVQDGMAATLDRICAAASSAAAEGMFGETAAMLRQSAEDSDSIAGLKAWWLYRMTSGPDPLTEMMTLFWHNLFATSNVKVRSTKHMAAQNDSFRRHATGDFKALLGEMARDVAMLIWLDGNANRLRSPNENFAREVMELFTLGQGNYTEADIREAARAFTGWHVRNDRFWFNRLQHDTGSKTVFGKSGNFDGDDVLRLCLAQEACPRFLGLRLLQEFVMPHPPAEAVAAVAASIRAHDYQMRPVLREVFGSTLFFSAQARRSLLKSPVRFVLGACRALEVRPNLQAAARLIAALGQDLFQPPTVKGWEGGRLWITSATMLQRANFAAALADSEEYGRITAALHSTRDLCALLLGMDTPPPAVEECLRAGSGSAEARMRGALQLILSLPEYQLC